MTDQPQHLVRADGAVLLDRVATAASFAARFMGLMGRAAIGEGEGLWFPGETSLHMLWMRFPITVAWLSAPDAGGWRTVTGVSVLRPWRDLDSAPRGTDGALEAHAGLAGRLAAGDRVALHPAA